MEKSHAMNNKNMISKLFFKLLPVEILLFAVGGVNAIIDGAIGARYVGEAAMAAIGFFFPIYQIIIAIGNVMLGGSQIQCGKALGRNDTKKTNGIFSLDLSAMTVVSVVFAVICLLLAGNIAGILADNSENTKELADYIRGYVPSIIATVLGSHLSGFLQMEGRQKRTYFGFVIMAVVNVVLDLLFVGYFNMGLFGLGLSTTLSSFAFFFCLVSFYFTKKSVLHFRIKDIDFSDLGPIIRIGFPGAISSICLAIRGAVLNALLMNFASVGPVPATGDEAVEALAAMNTFGTLLFAVSGGISATTRILVSVYVGEEDRDCIWQVLKTAMFKGTGLVLIAAAITAACSGLITGCFFPDPSSNVYILTKLLFIFYSVSMPLSCITMVFSVFFQSTGRLAGTHCISFVDGLAGATVTGVILAPFLGAVGVWIGQVNGGVLSVISALGYVVVLTKKIPKNFKEAMPLPDDLGVDDDDRLVLSVNNKEEVVGISIAAIEFCRKKNMSEKKAFHIGLSLEEIAANIVKHGFSDGKKHTTDIRIIILKDKVLLRVKDDCKTFNPKEMMEILNPEDITHNIGLRIVMRYVSDVEYQNALGLNILSLSYA